MLECLYFFVSHVWLCAHLFVDLVLSDPFVITTIVLTLIVIILVVILLILLIMMCKRPAESEYDGLYRLCFFSTFVKGVILSIIFCITHLLVS